MRKATLITIIFFTLISFTKSQSYEIGTWVNEKGTVKIETYYQEEVLQAKIVWMKESLDKNGKPKKDTRNPEQSLRSRNLIGIDMFYNFKKDRENEFSHGIVYNPKKGDTYNAHLECKSNKMLMIIEFGWLRKTVEWTRVLKV